MTYVESVVSKHKSNEIDYYARNNIVDPLVASLKQWAGECLQDITYSGSYAKGTSIDSTSDLDLFVSLKSSTNNTLKEIYTYLAQHLENNYSNTRRQNVSIRVSLHGYDIDVVPGKSDKGNTNYHKLYTRKKDSWIQTNVKKHIDLVKKSGRTVEISALKVWRSNFGLEFPSIMIELLTIQALKGKKIGDHDNNFWYLLQCIADSIESIRVVDPSNSNNVISDSLNKYEKTSIRKAALQCRTKAYWRDVLW